MGPCTEEVDVARRDDSPDFIEAIARGLDVIRAFGPSRRQSINVLVKTPWPSFSRSSASSMDVEAVRM